MVSVCVRGDAPNNLFPFDILHFNCDFVLFFFFYENTSTICQNLFSFSTKIPEKSGRDLLARVEYDVYFFGLLCLSLSHQLVYAVIFSLLKCCMYFLFCCQQSCHYRKILFVPQYFLLLRWKVNIRDFIK